MSQDGIGAMPYYSGGGSAENPKDFYGKTIKNATHKKEFNIFELEFTDGMKINISDNAQSCCEHRYMVCDDDPADIIDGELVRIEVSKVDVQEGQYGARHEIAFLIIESTKGSITICTHNEHNGYYGGFGLNISKVSE